MITTILIDDERKALSTLENKIKKLFPELQIIDKIDDPKVAYDVILEKQPQLLFLDIAMPYWSGFDLLKQLPRLDFEIIFTTGFDEYAIEAIQFCAIGYVVKPIQSVDLIQAVNNAKNRINLKQDNFLNKQLITNLLNPNNQDNKISIPMISGLEIVAVKNIIRCEGMERCTKIILESGEHLVSSYNLGEFKKLLEKYNFFSCHRSHLINLNHVIRYGKEGLITLSDNSLVPLARINKSAFLERVRS